MSQEQTHCAAGAVSRNLTGSSSEELKLIDDIALLTEYINQLDYLSFQEIRHDRWLLYFVLRYRYSTCRSLVNKHSTIYHMGHGAWSYQQ